jgi:hypothetical protein
MNKNYFLFILIFCLFVFTGCDDNVVTTGGSNALFSYDSLTCDYHDSVNFGGIPFYFKWIYQPVTNPSYTKVQFTGTVLGYYAADTGFGNPYVVAGLEADTSFHQPQPGDTLVTINKKDINFNITVNITYPANRQFHIVFKEYVLNPHRGDYIKVVNLKISRVS